MNKDSLGDRMKAYEAVARPALMRRTPVVVRVDGRAFHTFTRRMDRPFDANFIEVMSCAARSTMDEMQGCVLCYVQSDEASFLLKDWDRLESEPWFANDLCKIVSLTAATMTASFNAILHARRIGHEGDVPRAVAKWAPEARFDARAFNVPREEVANYFLWRARDFARNSVQMVAQSEFSHKELHQKNCDDLKAMILAKRGVPYEELATGAQRFGTFIPSKSAALTDVPGTYADIAALVSPLLASSAE